MISLMDMNSKSNLDWLQEVSLSQLKCVMKVAEFHSASRAADDISRTQTAVTKAVNKVEKYVGTALFERSSSGMWLTPDGELFVDRIRNAAFELRRAGNFFLHQIESVANVDTIPLFNMSLINKPLLTLIKVLETRDLNRAAKAVDVTPITVQRTIRKIESQLGVKLFVRTANNVLMPTVVASEIGTAIRAAFAEIQIGIDELHSREGVVRGQVRVGTLPFVRTVLVPKVITQMCQQYPEVSFSTNESPYELLERRLRAGDLDMIVGPTPQIEKHIDIHIEHFLKTGLYIIVRSGHPLAKGDALISKKQLESLGWLLPPLPALHREVFDRFMVQNDIKSRGQIVETGALNTMRSILAETDFAAISVVPNIRAMPKGDIAILMPDFAGRPGAPYMHIDYHILTRKRSKMSSPVAIFTDLLRKKAAEIALAEN